MWSQTPGNVDGHMIGKTVGKLVISQVSSGGNSLDRYSLEMQWLGDSEVPNILRQRIGLDRVVIGWEGDAVADGLYKRVLIGWYVHAVADGLDKRVLIGW